MRLRDLLEEIEVVDSAGDLNVEIGGLAYDSRKVTRGHLFFGIAGLKVDGAAYVPHAIAAGAAAVVLAGDLPPGDVARVRVREPRRALAQAAATWFGHPSRRLQVVGVTGTNGKTTTTCLLEDIFRAAGIPSGRIGTTAYRLGEEVRPAPFTTPEAPELQGLLREMAERGLRAVAMEMSSHALAQWRCFGVECDVAVFTNLSHEHLDYHGTLERYLDAKLMLFDGRAGTRGPTPATAVVNLDDPGAERVLEAARRGEMRLVTYGSNPRADVVIDGVEIEPRGLRFRLGSSGGVEVRLPLIGRFNAWNAAAAYSAAAALGIPPTTLVAGLGRARTVPGRLERVAEGQPFEVVVDYAHTPDALKAALEATREHARERLLLVFGCGGDRDRAKRPHMGRWAAELSDRAWITNDNPRGEDPETIAAEIAAGDRSGRLEIELDRRTAIGRALEVARPGDLVLIAGKGHETSQTIADRVVPFDDRAVVREFLRARAGDRG